MRDRKLGDNEEQKPTNTLRRSPRFLHGKETCVEYPETPKPAERKIRTPDSSSTPLGSSIARTQRNVGGISRNLKKYSEGSTRSSRLDCVANLSSLDSRKLHVADKMVTRSSVRGSRFVNNQVNECEKISKKVDREVTESKCRDKSSKGSNMSVRLKGGANVSKNEEILDSQKQYVIEKRVTRSSIRVNDFVNNDINSEKDSGERARVLSEEVKAKVGCVEKRVTCGTTRMKAMQSVEKACNVSTNKMHKMDISNERKPKGNGELYTSKRGVKKVPVGDKRKRHQVEEECDVIQGWTEEQELALRRAYFAAKPTPHFWKKVARMVPGKSADECFNRIYSDHLTPSQPRTRSRANKKQSSPVSYSASKLLSPADIKTKKLRTWRRTLLAHKTVRQLLEKQHSEDQDYKADLFSVLEPSIELSPLDFQESTPFASPVSNLGSSILTRCLEISSSSHKKQLSRLNCSKKAAFVSPPVLKQIKNKALHEKYIDQLHCRDAKRKAQSLRNAKSVREKDNKLSSQSEVNSVKVAKDALVFDAQDAINKFRYLQSSTNCDLDDDLDDDDDIISCNDDDEVDDELC